MRRQWLAHRPGHGDRSPGTRPPSPQHEPRVPGAQLAASVRGAGRGGPVGMWEMQRPRLQAASVPRPSESLSGRS